MRIKSAVIYCLLVFVLFGVISAQAVSSEIEDTAQKVLAGDMPVEISFWTGTGQANFPYLKAMVNAFQEAYPNISVDFSNQGPITELTAKLTQNIVSGTTPTLSNLNDPTFPEYIASEAIIDLADYFNSPMVGFSEEEKNDFFAPYLAEVISLGGEGTLYGFPTNKKTTDIFVYNKTFFDSYGWEAPATWDQVVEYSRLIFEETGKPGFSYDTSYGEAAFKTLSTQWGSPYVAGTGSIDINNQASLDALNFYRENMDLGYFTLPALMPSAGGNNSSNGFVMEECYMFVGAAAGIQYAVPNVASGHKDFEVGIAPIPQKDLENPATFMKGENYAIFSNATPEQRVAGWLLIKYLSGAEQNSEWLINTGNLPISQSMVENGDYQAFLASTTDSPLYYKASAVNAALEMMDWMRFDVAFSDAGQFAEEIGNMWKSIMIGGADVESTLLATAEQFE